MSLKESFPLNAGEYADMHGRVLFERPLDVKGILLN